jgi:hypothetical protein
LSKSATLSENKSKKDKAKDIPIMLKIFRPNTDENRTDNANKQLKSEISSICSWKKHRHKSKNDDLELEKEVQRFEKTLSSLIPWHDEKTKSLDNILQKANTSPLYRTDRR